MQLNPLTVQDPLSDKQIIINIQIQPSSEQRDQRTALVTVGVSGKAPVMLSGKFGQLNDLVNQAWREFSKGTPTTPKSTIAQVEVSSKPEKSNPNKESILSLF